jgi:hypothetical protein
MAYNGHRGPNVSEFIANLNAIPPAQELAEPEFNFDADLAMFTNTTFFDFDLGHNADLQPDMHFDMKPQQIENTQNNNAGTPVDFSKTNMDFLQSQYTDFVTLFCLAEQSISIHSDIIFRHYRIRTISECKIGDAARLQPRQCLVCHPASALNQILSPTRWAAVCLWSFPRFI